VIVLVYLAWKTLLRSRISFLLLVTAVTAGVGFQIPNTANIDGYTDELRRNGLARDLGHVIVTEPKGGGFTGADDLAARITPLPGVRGAVPRLIHAGTVFAGERQRAARVLGVDPDLADRGMGLCQGIAAGRCMRPGDDHPLLVGASVARVLDLHPGDEVKLAIPFVHGDDVRMVHALFHVVGILEGSGGFYIDMDVFVPIALLRDLFHEPGAASEIAVYLDAERDTRAVAARVSALAPDRKVEPWWDHSEFISNAIAGNRALSAISMTMVVIAVMIPVLSLLYVHVQHERRRIATIAALGFGRGEIFVLHLLQAGIVGTLGAGLGCLAGAGLCHWFRVHPIFSNAGFTVRPSMTPHAFVVPAVVLFATTLIAGIVPAILAARAEPSLELRRE
jgi:ABC-type lipoprotein release transport system permease subunit